MKTKHFIVDLFVAMAPGFFILILPTYLAGLLLAPPYNLIAWAIILAIGGAIIYFRDRVDARLADWRAGRGTHRVSGHGAARS